ncbi:phosphatidylinositol glycan anchor biosynthesis class U [Rhynchophorus ferrugineus]|uniref:phosphatidylinositol glycan anchor biosynthesis class U n=1 Tax=Rhynchophorus ferrugineus TaxID=354439 RepID=UPI003FCC47AE
MPVQCLKNGEKKEKPCGHLFSIKVGILVIFASVLRYIIMTSKYQTTIANHVEVSTPMNAWKRVLEGLFLMSKNVDPYTGDLLHETPSALMFYKVMMNTFYSNINLMFIVFDIATGLFLYAAIGRYANLFQEEHKDRKKYPEDVQEYLPDKKHSRNVSLYVLMAFLFNPYSLLGCVGHSTTGIHNFFLAVFIYGMFHGYAIVSAISLAVCSSVTFYHVILLSPLYIHFVKIYNSKVKGLLVVIYFSIFLALLTLYNSNYGQDFKFIKNVYGCIWTVPDLQPNIGLFWYFFTEMFDHFRELFIFSFQINATILYLLPLSLTFRNRPFILTVALMYLIVIFKSYPCLSDIGFVLSFLPTFIYLFAFCQQGFVVAVILLMTSCLAPILWHLWIYSASANANFYFGVTLAYAIAQIFLVTDILFAHTKWEFALRHGKQAKIDGKDANLSLE